MTTRTPSPPLINIDNRNFAENARSDAHSAHSSSPLHFEHDLTYLFPDRFIHQHPFKSLNRGKLILLPPNILSSTSLRLICNYASLNKLDTSNKAQQLSNSLVPPPVKDPFGSFLQSISAQYKSLDWLMMG